MDLIFYQILIVAYLVICNLAVIVRLYKSFLRYLNPIKGYAASLVLLLGLGAIDYFVYDFTAEKLDSLSTAQTAADQNNTFRQVSFK